MHTYQLLVSALILARLLFRGLVGVLSAASLIHFGGKFKRRCSVRKSRNELLLQLKKEKKSCLTSHKQTFLGYFFTHKKTPTTSQVTSFQIPFRVKTKKKKE